MNYEEMSDLEVNRLVAKHMGGYAGDCGEWLRDGVKVKDPEFSFLNTERAYCSSPLDAWSIILVNKITISPQSNGDQWQASASLDDKFDFEFECWDRNPLRAVCICFLEMKEQENG